MSPAASGFAVPLSGRARYLLEREPKPDSKPAVAVVVSDAMRAAVGDALQRGETHYTDRPGILPLRVAVAQRLTSRFGIAADAQADIVITCGVAEARFVATQQLLTAGAILAAPAFGGRLEGAAALRRAPLVTEIGTDTSVLYLASSMPEEGCRAALAGAPANAAILYEIDEQGNHFHPGQLEGCTVRTTTIGRLGEEGWRIGYLVSPAADSPGMRDLKQALTICSTNLSQWALLAALSSGEVTL